MPFSGSPHRAHEVTERVRQAKLSSRALESCLFLHRQTFGNAGWHRKQRRPEWRYHFDLSTWAKALACDKSNLRRLRLGLEQCRIVCFEPDPDDSGQGWLGWNLQFAEWQPYDGRRTRRPGQQRLSQQGGVVNLVELSGRPLPGQPEESGRAFAQAAPQAAKQQPCVVSLTPQAGAGASDQQGGMVNSAGGQDISAIHQVSVVKWLPLAGEASAAKQPRPLAEIRVQLTTPASSEVPPTAVSAVPVRKDKRNNTETPLVVSELLCISPAEQEQVQTSQLLAP